MLTTWGAVTALDRMFDDVMGSMVGTATNPNSFVPEIDVRANDDEIVFVCDVPGIKESDLEVYVENQTLHIKGTRKFEAREHEQVMLGRTYGAFHRSFTLPSSLDEEKLSADLSDGVLTLRIPKLPKAKPRKIQIGKGPPPKQLNE